MPTIKMDDFGQVAVFPLERFYVKKKVKIL